MSFGFTSAQPVSIPVITRDDLDESTPFFSATPARTLIASFISRSTSEVVIATPQASTSLIESATPASIPTSLTFATSISSSQSLPPSSTPSLSENEETNLPGMKRGIAIGVGVCVTIMIIALVTYLAFRRRRRLREAAAAGNIPDAEKYAEQPGTPLPPPSINGDMSMAPQDPAKTYSYQHHSVFLESDSSALHEMDTGSGARELQAGEGLVELKGDERMVYELDGNELERKTDDERTEEQKTKDRFLRVQGGA
ncbi:hypothetical protein BU24DRAFT_266824 [Aaosphaeria arxii CBS 175.79]|uniref:Mid2 domain-containing protein n=1 Tax=Aaosphaeria arxii CBS 175.79 TaxID=1450172 RepID=A0A6A5XFT1_9PLEO|nr:uncharacterized protein BU24DRAFT_266824 [Aaosphaeria arxii CBS 175.79]KAF2011942.1 hypothetical protein BU24DRAFT_266824 [Aaosphaeria arxii CBS 175.79]